MTEEQEREICALVNQMVLVATGRVCRPLAVDELLALKKVANDHLDYFCTAKPTVDQGA